MSGISTFLTSARMSFAFARIILVAAIVYGLYWYFTPDYLEDFDDDFDEDFDDDFFEDEDIVVEDDKKEDK